jgi:hypothetical protein
MKKKKLEKEEYTSFKELLLFIDTKKQKITDIAENGLDFNNGGYKGYLKLENGDILTKRKDIILFLCIVTNFKKNNDKKVFTISEKDNLIPYYVIKHESFNNELTKNISDDWDR